MKFSLIALILSALLACVWAQDAPVATSDVVVAKRLPPYYPWYPCKPYRCPLCPLYIPQECLCACQCPQPVLQVA